MAASDARPQPLYATAYRRSFAFRTSAGAFATSWTGVAATISLDGGPYVATTNAPVEIGTSGTGYLDLTAAEMTADSVLVIITVTNPGTVPLFFPMTPQAVSDLTQNAEAIWDAQTAAYIDTGSMGLALGTLGAGVDPAAIATSVWTLPNAIEVGWTPQQAMRIISAALAGLVSGADTGMPIFRAINNTAPRITATTDQYGNRSVVTLTP